MTKCWSFALLLVCCISIGMAGQGGLRGPADGVKPTVVVPQNMGPNTDPGYHSQMAPGYLSITGHAEDVKVSNIGPNVSLGGTPNGTGGTYAPGNGTGFSASTQNGWIPYDAAIAVGPNHVVVCTNEQIEVYSRSGGFIARYSTTNSFFPTDAGGSFDPKCYYDAAAGHFVILYDQESNPLAFMNVAVSQTSDPTGSWWKYHLDWTLDGSTSTGNWGDYPSLGYDDNAIYIGANQYSFSNSYKYSKVRVLSKAQLFSGATATWTDFINLKNGDGTSAFTPKACRNLSSSASEYLINTVAGGASYVTLWRIDNAPSAPTLTRVSTVSVGTYAPPPNGRQPGGSSVADGDCRTQDAVVQNGVLYTAFTEKYGSTRRNQGAGIRYLQVTTSGAKQKDISYFASGEDRFYPAVTVDPAGNMFMTYGASSTTQYASLYSTGMTTAESAIESPVLLKAGQGTVTSGRWGDYSGIANDFSSTGAVWMFGGWSQSNGAWATYVQATSFGTAPKMVHQNAGQSAPATFALGSNYPNPFNPTTNITYSLAADGPASMVVYDGLGRTVATLVNGVETAGSHTVSFDASALASGVYYCRLQSGLSVSVQKMLLSR